jgi:predicted porin
MNKKVMAVAVAGLFTVPGVALAQKSTVEIYGRANLGLDWYEAKGATNPYNNRQGRYRVFDGSSRVGFRGTEDLGSGLRAIFQIETGVNVDSGSNIGQGGQANTSSGFWASRDSFVGLDSNFGRLTFGRQSIFWANGVNAQFAANYINTEIPWTNGTQLGRISTALGNAAAPARVSNTVQYTSPTFAGMNVTASWSPGSNEAVQNIGAGTQTNGSVIGLTGRGTWGPFYAQIDWANVKAPQTNTPAGVFTQSEGDAYKIGGSWGYMPGARIGVIWVRQEVNNAAGSVPGVAAGNEVDQDGWTINWEHTFGPVQVLAQYGWLGDLKGCNALSAVGACANSDATAWMVGARYFFSKRTWAYLSYNEVSNKANQFVDYTGGGITSTVGAPSPLGADPTIFALVLFHAF